MHQGEFVTSRWWAILFFAVALAPFLLVQLYPFVDLYNHAARLFVLTHFDEVPRFREWYAPAWALMPNLGFDLAAWPIFKWLPPLMAAKVSVLALVSLMYWGGLAAMQLMRADLRLAAPVAALFSHNYVLGWGFINFLLGFALSLFLLRLTLDDDWRLVRRHYLIQVPLAFMVFLCHGLAFVFYGLMAGTLIFAGWWQRKDRNIRALITDGLWLAGHALVPVAAFFVTRTAEAGGSYAVGVDRVLATYPDAGSLMARTMWELKERIVVTMTTVESGFFVADLVLNGLLFVALLYAFVRHRKLAGNWPPLMPVIASLLLLVTIPPNFFGASYLEIRVPLLLLIALTAGLTAAVRTRAFVAALSFGAIVQSAMLGAFLQESETAYSEYLAEASVVIEPGALVKPITIAPINGRRDSLPRCQPIDSLLMLTHPVGAQLFTIPGQQPLQAVGEMAAAGDAMPSFPRYRHGFNQPFTNEKLKALAASGFDYAILCGSARGDAEIPANFRPVLNGSFYDIYRIEPISAP